MTVASCKGQTKDGKPCAAKPRPGMDLCPWHSPELAERRTEWSRRGGVNSSNKARIRKQLPDAVLSPTELQGLLSKALRDVLTGKLEPGPANAAGGLARALVTIKESADLEERLAALEAAAGLNRKVS
jgi:hypothetical protein